MAPRTMTQDEAVADFHALYVLDEKNGRLRSLQEYQRRFPGFEEIVSTEYAFLNGTLDAGQADRLRNAALAPSDAGLESGRDIGPYRLVRKLGRGAQGTVYLAEERALRREIALKVLANTWLFSDEHRVRFRREARAAARLDHPGICTIHTFGQEQDIDYIAMRYVEGTTLGAVLRRAHAQRAQSPDAAEPAASDARTTLPLRPTSPSELKSLLFFFERAADALHAAHEAGVLHRDVKPGNIMVTRELAPVILDFGLARDIEGESDGVSHTGQLLGTRGYIAPEQMRGGAELDERADVYSLGVVLYECLTLARPFPQPTWETLRHTIEHEPAPDVREQNPSVPRDVATIVATALENEIDRRYRTARALAEDLRRARAGEPILAVPASLTVRSTRWVQRHASMLVKVGVVVALGVTTVSTYVLFEQQVEAREKRDFASRLQEYDRAVSVALEDAHAVSGGVNLRARIDDFDGTLRAGGLDLLDAPSAAVVALEPSVLDKGLWMAFQLVEDVDAVSRADATSLPADPSSAPNAARSHADLRAGAVRFLDGSLAGHAARVWRAHRDEEPPDGESFQAVRRDVLASQDLLARMMLNHVAWTRADAALAREALSDDAIRSAADRGLQRAAYMDRGACDMKLGRFADAKRSFELGQASATYPDFFFHFNMARLAVNDANEHANAERTAAAAEALADAEEHLQYALDIRPDSADVLASLASVQSHRDFEAAYGSAHAAARIDPENASAHLELGRACIGLRRFDEAFESLDRALRRDERLESAIDFALDGVGPADVDRCVAKLLDSTEPSAFWLAMRARAKVTLQDFDAALAFADQALAVEPDQALAHYWRGDAQRRRGEPEHALSSFDAFLEAPPDDQSLVAWAHDRRAKCFDALRRPESATDEYFHAARKDPAYVVELVRRVQRDDRARAAVELTRLLVELEVAPPRWLVLRTAAPEDALQALDSALEEAQDAPRDACDAVARALRGCLRGSQPCDDAWSALVSSVERWRSALREASEALAAARRREDARAIFRALEPRIADLPNGPVRDVARSQADLALRD